MNELMFSPEIIFVLSLIILVLIFAILGVKQVNQSKAVIIERFGKFHKKLTPGINFIIPGFDKVKSGINLYTIHHEIESGKNLNIPLVDKKNQIDLAEQVLDPPELNAITSDNAIVHPDLVMYFLITEPEKTVYNVNNIYQSMNELLTTLLRQEIGKLDSDAVITSREQIGIACKEYLEKAAEPWGVRITRIEIQAIRFDQEVQTKLTEARESELVRRAEIIKAKEERDKAILIAEGEKESQILKAEGEKQSKLKLAEAEKEKLVLEAQGKFESDKLVAEGQFLMASREEEGKAKGVAAMAAALQKNPEGIVALEALKAQREIANSYGQSANTMILPAETAGIFGAIGSIKHALNYFKDDKEKAEEK